MPRSLSDIFGGGTSEAAPKQQAVGSSETGLFSYIDRYAPEYQSVPSGVLKSLAVQESGAGQNMTSVVNPGRGTAKGPFQFIDTTAKAYIPDWQKPSDSYDFDKSTRGAFRYLDDLIKRTGSLEKALIHYHGRGVDSTGKDSWSYAEDILNRSGANYNKNIIEQDKKIWERESNRTIVQAGSKARSVPKGAKRSLADILSGADVSPEDFQIGPEDYDVPDRPTPLRPQRHGATRSFESEVPGSSGATRSFEVEEKEIGGKILGPIVSGIKTVLRAAPQYIRKYDEIGLKNWKEIKSDYEQKKRSFERAKKGLEADPDNPDMQKIYNHRKELFESIKKFGEVADDFIDDFEKKTKFGKAVVESPLLKHKEFVRAETPVARFAQDVANGAPQMVSMIAANALGGTPLTAITIFNQIAAGKFEELEKEGVDIDRQIKAGIFSALAQAPLEALPISKLTGGIKKRAVKEIGGAMVEEFFTEWFQKYPDAVADIWAKSKGKTNEERIDQFVENLGEITKQGLYEGVVAATLAGFVGGGGVALNRKAEAKIREVETQLQEYMNEVGREISARKAERGPDYSISNLKRAAEKAVEERQELPQEAIDQLAGEGVPAAREIEEGDVDEDVEGFPKEAIEQLVGLQDAEIEQVQEETQQEIEKKVVDEKDTKSVDKPSGKDYVIVQEPEGKIGDENYREYPKKLNKKKFGDVEITEGQRDKLSGLPNQNVTTKHIEEARGEENWLGEIDGDEFKSVNDTQGHAEGDRVIGLVGQIAEEYFPDKFVGRKGGEEFYINFGKYFTADDQKRLAAMHDVIPKRIRVAGAPFTVSIGVGKADHNGRPAEDWAMYKGKEKGRNIIAIANESATEINIVRGADVGRKQYAKDKRAQVMEQYADEAFEEGEIDEQERDRIKESARKIRTGRTGKVIEQPGRPEKIRRVAPEEERGIPELRKGEEKSRETEVKEPQKAKKGKLTYEQFREKYQKAYDNMMKYSSDQAGSVVYAEEMAGLADEYPEFAERAENEREERISIEGTDQTVVLRGEHYRVLDKNGKVETFYIDGDLMSGFNTRKDAVAAARGELTTLKGEKDAKEVRKDEGQPEEKRRTGERSKEEGGEGIRRGVEEPKRGGKEVEGPKKETVKEGKDELEDDAQRQPEGKPTGKLPDTGERKAPEPISKQSGKGGGRQVRGPDRERTAIKRSTGDGDKRVPDNTSGRLNYRITPDDDIGKGGAVTKYNNNVEAIKILKKVEDEGRYATLEEQKKLVQYVGWGGISNVFKKTDKRYQELKDLLTDEEYAAARKSTQNAHYTSPEVVSSMWDALVKMGFKGGRVLEPAVGGSGVFLGLRPDIANMQLYGVEMDNLSARIAKQLYQDASIQNKPYENIKMPEGAYPVIISNVPFSDTKPFEKKSVKTPGIDKQYSLHDFYFLKSLYGLQPGGVMAFVTSRYTMDKIDPEIRKKISEQANLVGAYRLPKTAFKRIANTDVVTDVIFLQKKIPGEKTSDLTKSFINSKEIEVGGKRYFINEYYHKNKDMVIGDHSSKGSMRTADEYTVELPKDTTPEQFANRLKEVSDSLPSGIMSKMVDSKTDAINDNLTESYKTEDFENLPYGSFAIDKDGKLVQKNEKTGKIESKEGISKTKSDRIKGMIGIKNAAKRLFAAQREGEDSKALLKDLNSKYDNFVKENGFISQRGNKLAMKEDPEIALLLSLENWDRETKKATKADVLNGATITKLKPPDKVNSDIDALSLSLTQYGGIDIGYMAKLRNVDPEVIENRLIDDGLIFKDPITDNNIVADEYLSGNVREKLRIAKEYAEKNDKYNKNVVELQKVMPVDLEPADIVIRPNSPVLEKSDVEQFIRELIDPSTLQISYIPINGKWSITGYGWNSKIRLTYGTPRVNAFEVLNAVMNDRQIVVKDKKRVESSVVEVVNEEATEEVQSRIEEVKRAFEDWIWKDNDRAQRVARKYNEEFNSEVPRKYVHPLLMSNPNAEVRFDGSAFPYPARIHQANAVYRQIQSPATMLAHVVGSGKTLEMVWAGMEMRRLGLRKKPVYVVPNHMLVQFTKEFYQAYPAAKVLMATEADFKKDRRRLFLNKIATGDWDGVVVTQSQFKLMPVSKQYEVDFLKKRLKEYEKFLEEADKLKTKPRSVKDLEKAKDKMEARIEKLLDNPKDEGVIPFDDLGIDHLFVDEADMFKNLEYQTSLQGVRGLGIASGSQQAFDMLMKVRLIQNISGGVTFATGTPISNTLVEAYSMMRYLQPGMIKQLGIESFDAWRRMFAQEVTQVELNNTGTKYVPVTRFSKIVNVPELMKLLRKTWDIKTAKSLEEDKILVPGKQLPYSKIVNVAAPSTPMLKSYLKHLEERESALGGKPEKGSDNVLVIITDGKKAAVDLRMIHESLPDNPKSKLNMAVDKMVELYNDYKKKKYTTAVFIDQPRSKREGFVFFDAVQDMKKKLIANGVKESEIAIAQEAKTHLQRQEMFEKVRNGKIRIIFGSTQKMGAGTNFQDKLKAVIHLDAPWRPRDIQQRNGRAVRSGNKTGEVEIYNFVTKGSLDTGIWNVLETKSKAIETIMTGKDENMRELEEDYFGSAKELSIDNPLMKESMELRNDIKKLEGAKRAYVKQTTRARQNVQSLPKEIDSISKSIEKHKEDLSLLPEEPKGDKFEMTIGGKEYEKPGDAGKEIIKILKKMDKDAYLAKEKEIGKFVGLKMGAEITADGARVILHAKNYQYSLRFKIEDDSPTGVITKIRNSVYKQLPEMISGKGNRLKNAKSDLEENKKIAKKTFDKNDELIAKEERLKQVMKKLEEEAKAEVKKPKAEGDFVDWRNLSKPKEIFTVEENEVLQESDDIDESFAMQASAHSVDLPVEPRTSNRVNKTQIIRYIEDAWGVPVRTKGMARFRDAGRYYPKKVLIRLKKWGEIEVLVHEVAHHLDSQMKKRLGVWWKTKGAKKVKPLIKELKDLDYDQNKRRTAEGFAEFMRHYLTTGKAESLAPGFYNFFNSSFLQKNPAEARKLQKLKKMIDTWQDQGALARIEQQIDRNGEHTKLPKERYFERLKDSAYAAWVDSLYPLMKKTRQIETIIGRKLRPTENPYLMAQYYSLKTPTLTRTMVMDGMIDMYGNRVGKSLREILEPIRPQDMDIFTIYAVAVRAKHLESRGIESGLDIKDINNVIKKYKSNTWDKAVDEITEWSNSLIDWLVQAGSLSKADALEIRRLNPVYVPFKRAFVDYADEVHRLGRPGLGGGTDGGSGVHKIKGSGRPIIDPIQSLITQASEVIAKAQKVHVARLVADLAENENLGGLVTRVPAPSKAVQFEEKQIQGQLEELGYEIPSGDMDNFLTVFTTGMPGGKDNVVSVWQNGERKYYELDPELYGVLKSLDMPKTENFMWLLGGLNKFARLTRLGATGLNPAFGLFRNPARDVQTYLMQTQMDEKEALKRIGHSFKGAFAGNRTELERRFERAGGRMVGIMGFDRAQTRKAYDEILASKLDAKGKTLYVLKHPGIALDAFRDILSFTEMIPRSAELSGMYEKYRAENPTWTDEDCFVAAFNAAQDVTVNFTRSGSVGRYLNMAIPFFNASIQGTEKAYRTLKDNPKRYVLRGLAYLSVPAMIFYWKNRDEEWFNDLPLGYKYSNFFIQVPFTDEVIRIPIPFEAGSIFCSTVMAAFDGAQGKGKESTAALMSVMSKNLPEFIPAAFGPMVDIWKNKNYLGKPIEHKGMQYVPSEERTTRWTTAHSKLLSKGFNSIGIELSPVQIDYLIAQYTGGLSRRVAIRKVEKPSDVPVLRDILLGGQGVPRRQLDKFFTRYEKLSQKRTASKTGLSEKLYSEFENLKLFKKTYDKYYAPALREAKKNGDDELRDQIYSEMRTLLFEIGIE